jgi:hypothetical protein
MLDGELSLLRGPGLDLHRKLDIIKRKWSRPTTSALASIAVASKLV